MSSRFSVMLLCLGVAAVGCQGPAPGASLSPELAEHLRVGLDSCLELPPNLPPHSRTSVPSNVNMAIEEAWNTRIDAWFEGIRSHDERAYLRSGYAIAHLLLSFWERWKPGDLVGRRALNGVAEWLGCPCQHHRATLGDHARDLEREKTPNDGHFRVLFPAKAFEWALSSLLRTIRDPRSNDLAPMHAVIGYLVQDADTLGLSRAYVMADKKTDPDTADEEREIADELFQLGSKAAWFRALHAAVCAELGFDRPSRAQ